MIITHKTHKKDWQWLREIFDSHRDGYYHKNNIGPSDQIGINADAAIKYASVKMAKMGLETQPFVIRSDYSHYDRTFIVSNTDKFIRAKLSR